VGQIADALAQGNWQFAPVGERDRVMLGYVAKLTLTPGTVTEDDVQQLRDAGFSDRAIGDIAANCALFAFFLRIVDGLGASLEPGMDDDARRLGIGRFAGGG
jgi:alkylhydroperoxidase family enzyme